MAASCPARRRAQCFLARRPARPTGSDALTGTARADLLIVGGGFTGLWAAFEAKRRDPDRDVVLLEADRVAAAGSGRNGGFCSATLTHGAVNGASRFGDALGAIIRFGRDNLDGLLADVTRLEIDCDVRRVGEIDVATRPHELAALRHEHDLLASHGDQLVLLDADEVRAELDSRPSSADSTTWHGTVTLAWPSGCSPPPCAPVCGSTSTPGSAGSSIAAATSRP